MCVAGRSSPAKEGAEMRKLGVRSAEYGQPGERRRFFDIFAVEG